MEFKISLEQWLLEKGLGEKYKSLNESQKKEIVEYYKRNRIADMATDLYIEYMKCRELEVSQQVNAYNNGIGSQLKLYDSLSMTGKEDFGTLKEIMGQSGVLDINAVVDRVGDLLDRRDLLLIELQQQDMNKNKVVREIEKAKILLEKISAHEKDIFENEDNEVVQNIEYLKTDLEKTLLPKKQEYETKVQRLSEYVDSNVEKRNEHSTLVQFAASIPERQKEVDDLKQSLSKYNDLPPDIKGAKIKIRQAEEELRRLEELWKRSLINE